MNKPDSIDQRIWNAFKKKIGEIGGPGFLEATLWEMWLDGYSVGYDTAKEDFYID